MIISVVQEVITYLRKKLKICSLIPILINAFYITDLSALFILNKKGLSHLITTC